MLMSGFMAPCPNETAFVPDPHLYFIFRCAVLQGLPERSDVGPGHSHQRFPEGCSPAAGHDGAAGSQ
eukprot:scaffold35876_cov19-Tisochrysis_lutea.AAC.1